MTVRCLLCGHLSGTLSLLGRVIFVFFVKIPAVPISKAHMAHEVHNKKEEAMNLVRSETDPEAHKARKSDHGGTVWQRFGVLALCQETGSAGVPTVVCRPVYCKPHYCCMLDPSRVMFTPMAMSRM